LTDFSDIAHASLTRTLFVCDAPACVHRSRFAPALGEFVTIAQPGTFCPARGVKRGPKASDIVAGRRHKPLVRGTEGERRRLPVSGGAIKEKEPPLPAAQVLTGRRQTEWTGATQRPEDGRLQ